MYNSGCRILPVLGVRQQGGCDDLLRQLDEHKEILQLITPVLAAQLHGCVHVVAPVYWRENNRDAALGAECV